MSRYIARRAVIALLTLFVLATATFFLVKLLPGNPFLNDKVPPEIQQKQMEYYGLDKPVVIQYITYLKNLIQGDLGTSLKYIGRKVTDVIGESFPTSAVLGLIAIAFSQLCGLTFGILSAQFKNRWPDYLLMLIAIAGVALPSMVIGPLLRYAFGVRLQILPVSGWGSWQQVVLPAFVLSLSNLASTTRNMRASMLGVTTQDYIRTARSKGLPPGKIIMRHEFKNSMIPIVTNLGPTIATMIMGSFVVEQIFVIPGLGKHFVNAVNTLDYPLVMGITIFYGAFLVTMSLLVDIVYGLVDPRIRLS
ncbi:MAG TPA: ABC transporter permease [Candidatus Ventrousia excrementavium]|uniref:ABC transporter permease n=1 Tax=Candidatus Ventrousia excrementavium TaxID=2840961 RepID=A0A9D1LLM4_9CLOT|nr:ABC transporter permease [Candidatus Ventrousia excrementavium]